MHNNNTLVTTYPKFPTTLTASYCYRRRNNGLVCLIEGISIKNSIISLHCLINTSVLFYLCDIITKSCYRNMLYFSFKIK